MRRNISIKNKKGFSLVELCIVIGIMAVLAGSIAPVFIKRIQIKAGEKTSQEIAIIEQAGLAYFAANSSWPASLTVLKNAGYLNPSWTANNPWQNPYAISSSTSGFTVSTVVPQEWAGLVARDLPASSVSGTTVTSSVPSPGTLQSDSLPAGSIIMWSGTVASIPGGWQLCNGTNGTPDLRDKFVVGARQDFSGAAMTNVSGGLTQSGGEAYHTLTINEIPAHTHTYQRASNSSVGTGGGVHAWRDETTFTTNTGTAGGGSPHNNLPPYYALCFIMKIE